MRDWKLTVGMEVHVELETKTKMFCGCKNDPFHSDANTNVCPVCYGLPGALPLLNQEAIKMTVKLGRALKGDIASKTFWARKNYFYPDLPKGYQISQSTAPIVGEATLTIDGVGHRIERIHLEEDAGKLTHAPDGGSLVDYNRAGVPLMEVVTRPDFHSAEDAKRFCQELQRIVRTLKISSADMEKGQMRCEANISVSKDDNLGTKVEVKNINSFRAVEKAITYEYERQIKALEAGEKLMQETRNWSDAEGKTIPMRSKETSADYRYFPEPDLPYVEIEDGAGEEIALPEEQKEKLITLGVSKDLAQVIVDRHQAEKLLEYGDKAGELAKIYLAKPEVLNLSHQQIGELIEARSTFGLTKDQIAQIVEEAVNNPEKSPTDMAKDLASNGDELGPIIEEVIKDNPQPLADYKAGKENAFHYLVGQVMAKTKGRANIQKVREALEQLIR